MDEENKLYYLREEIDSIDAELITLLESRLKLTDEIGKVKSSIKKPLLDESREKKYLETVLITFPLNLIISDNLK